MDFSESGARRLSALAKFAWGVVAYNFAVVAWGAFVRATVSGDGCGEHWPLCNGEVVPSLLRLKTLIELTHRLMSGLLLILIVAFVVWIFRATRKDHPARVGAALSGFFILTEALVGAVLVKFGLVAKNDSIARAFVMSFHLTNTLLLFAALGLTAWWLSGRDEESLSERWRRGSFATRNHNLTVLTFALALFGALLLGVSGAVTALGATLFPVASLSEGLRQDLSPTAHLLVRLRIFHPVIAVTVCVFLAFVAVQALRMHAHLWIRRLARLLLALVASELAAGVFNLLLHAPVWLQLVHLILADAMWLALALLASSILIPSKNAVIADERSGELILKDVRAETA